jgi:hypothetical protein
MPIYSTLDASSYNPLAFLDADMIRVGEAFARLNAFVAGSDALDVFKCDAGTYSAVRRASARIMRTERDKTTTFVQYKTTTPDGRKVWKRLKKGASAPKGAETRESTITSHSSDAIRKSIAALRDSHNVSIRREAQVSDDGVVVVALVRNADSADSDS